MILYNSYIPKIQNVPPFRENLLVVVARRTGTQGLSAASESPQVDPGKGER